MRTGVIITLVHVFLKGVVIGRGELVPAHHVAVDVVEALRSVAVFVVTVAPQDPYGKKKREKTSTRFHFDPHRKKRTSFRHP